MTSQPHLLREQTPDGIVVLTFNRPETLNALSNEIVEAIAAEAAASKLDESIRVIVLTGTGRGFCSGADLTSGGPAYGPDGIEGRGRAEVLDKMGRGGRLLTALEGADVPIIGAINGVAAGAGFGLALSCDVRIASDQARMGSVFIKRGLGPDFGTSYWLPRLVGLAKAYELLYSGEVLGAEQALALGLVNRVVPQEALMDETMAFARMIAAGPPLAYAYTRRAVLRSFDNSHRQQLELEWTQQAELFGTEDAYEGVRAFKERRVPRFNGR